MTASEAGTSPTDTTGSTAPQATQDDRPTRLAIIASKGDLDMAYPPLMMAVQALRKGWEVGIFFTFYGLQILRDEDDRDLRVSPLGNPAMPTKMPALVAALPGMEAMATKMMTDNLEDHEVPSIQDLLEELVEGGAQLFPCGFTIDVFGFEQGDFIEGAQARCGSPDFLEFAKDADSTVFV